MKILAIETSSIACSLALLINDEIKLNHQILPMQQTEVILPMIDALLKDNNIELNQLDAIAFGCGPGSFTGVRIATCVAQGLGYALNKPLIPVSSLAALAQSAYQDLGWKKLIVAVDARMQEIYTATYQVNSAGIVELIGDERVCKPSSITLPTDDWYAVGNAWEVYQDVIVFKPSLIDSTRIPTSSGVVHLAKIKYKNQVWISAKEAIPAYIRNEVAQKAKV